MPPSPFFLPKVEAGLGQREILDTTYMACLAQNLLMPRGRFPGVTEGLSMSCQPKKLQLGAGGCGISSNTGQALG